MDSTASYYFTKNKAYRYSELSSGYIYYRDYRINLVSGKKEEVSIDSWIKSLRSLSFEKKFTKKIIHLFYELGELSEDMDHLQGTEILVIDLQYKSRKIFKDIFNEKIKLDLLKGVSFEEYKKSFNEGRQDLLNGNCYQFNLTFPFSYLIQENIDEKNLFARLNSLEGKRGAFAHGSFIPYLNKVFLSNSPESLFQGKRLGNSLKLWTSPIKGSLSYNSIKDRFIDRWKKLSSSKKDQGELFMIADLLRNDLNKIQKPIAKVLALKKPLIVPGIIHQYSLLSVDLTLKVTLFQVIKALFPGGSITGAPKKSVIELLKKIEGSGRGFYCGSTLILDGDLLAGSINIRSAEINLNNSGLLVYAGGGITLRSDLEGEFDEMMLKRDSFVQLF